MRRERSIEIGVVLTIAVILTGAPANAAAGAEREPKMVETWDDAVRWLENKCTAMIHESRVPMQNGIAAFPPQVGAGYDAFWLRDYAYMLEGNLDAFSDKELKDACRLFVGSIRDDGAGVDCIGFDGRKIYKPGFGSLGDHPVADGSQFTVDVAWHTFRKTQDKEFLGEIIDGLIKTLGAAPRNPATGLIHIRPDREWDRCAYGFTDTVQKTGDVLFSSLLLVQADRQLADLLHALGRETDAEKYGSDAERVSGKIRETFWDNDTGLFRAATVRCREHDIWGSAFAVHLGVSTKEQTQRVADYFKQHYDKLVQHGQVRHTPGGVYWEKARERDVYQNGAYWATPAGWFIDTLDRTDPVLARQTFIDLVNDFQKRGVNEWVIGDRTRLPDYNASAALPLAGVKAIRERRAAKTSP